MSGADAAAGLVVLPLLPLLVADEAISALLPEWIGFRWGAS